MTKFLLLLTLSLLAFPNFVDASVKQKFDDLAKDNKGPFSLNYLQGTVERVTVTNGRSPRKTFLFQAAFRNELGRALEADGFYVANLFTTNYYELMGEYVFGDRDASHELDHQGLVAASAQAMPKAASMVQHWVLEKSYVEKFPSSHLSRAFKLRGISGSEFEQVYANHFFNFYLGALDGDFQYLPAFLLATKSPIVDSSSLAKARDMISASYDSFLRRWGANDSRVKAMYRLRNSIHNTLTSAVIHEIDQYLRDFPFYEKEGNTYLQEIRRILVEYYSFGVEKIAKQSAKLGHGALKAAADQVAAGVNADSLLALSRAAADLRTNISQVEYSKRALTLALLADTSRFLNKEISSLRDVNSPAVVASVLNTIYLEGFLIKDNWEYFLGEAQSGNAKSVLTDVIDVAGGATLPEAFAPALDQWLSVEPKMAGFLDNTIKGSALSTASNVIEKL